MGQRAAGYRLFVAPHDDEPPVQERNFAALLGTCNDRRADAVRKIRQCVNEQPENDGTDNQNGRAFFRFYHSLEVDEVKEMSDETVSAHLKVDLCSLAGQINNQINAIKNAVRHLTSENAAATLFPRQERLLSSNLAHILEGLENWKANLERAGQWSSQHRNWYTAQTQILNEVQTAVFTSQERILMQGIIVRRLSQTPLIIDVTDPRAKNPVAIRFISEFERSFFTIERERDAIDNISQRLTALSQKYRQLKQMVDNADSMAGCLTITTASFLVLPLIILAVTNLNDDNSQFAFLGAGIGVAMFIICCCTQNMERAIRSVRSNRTEHVEFGQQIRDDFNALVDDTATLVGGMQHQQADALQAAAAQHAEEGHVAVSMNI